MKAKSQPIRVAAVPAAPASGQTSQAVAGRVLQLEAEGILALARGLEQDAGPLNRAIELLQAVTGRVVVSGMGKSGHIARKIAATLASTGTPAQFVHPAEASH